MAIPRWDCRVSSRVLTVCWADCHGKETMNFDDVLAQEEYLFMEGSDAGQTVPLDSLVVWLV